jgi:hypothetical protein
MSVRQAQMQISSAEFTEWMAFYLIEPFGDMVADQRHGVATALHANLNRDSKVRPEPYRADDFIHWRDVGPVEETEPELLDNPVAQANLIRAKMFGLPPK